MTSITIPQGGAGRNTLPPVNSHFFSGPLDRTPDGHLSDYVLAPLFGGRSLEDHIDLGDEKERRRARETGERLGVPITVNTLPSRLWITLRYLAEEARLGSTAVASRFVTRCGLEVLERIEALPRLYEAWRRIYESGSEEHLEVFATRPWTGFLRLSQRTVATKISVFPDVAARLASMGAVCGLSLSTMVTAALVAGIAQSTWWLPDEVCKACAEILVDEFCTYLERRVRAVEPVVPPPTG